jgi:hypothetical protein
MAADAGRPAPHDPAERGFDGERLSPVDPPASDEAPSPAWLAQLGRAPIGDYADGRQVLKRLTEAGLAVPGDDPLYQYLGAQRMFAEVLQAQHDEQMARMRTMHDEARQGMVQLLAEARAAGASAVAARRAEDEAALKRFSAELEGQAASAARMLREAMAEERNAATAAIAVKVAEALARGAIRNAAAAGPGGLWQGFGDLGPAWAARSRSAAAWAALLAMSVIVGLVLLRAFKH